MAKEITIEQLQELAERKQKEKKETEEAIKKSKEQIINQVLYSAIEKLTFKHPQCKIYVENDAWCVDNCELYDVSTKTEDGENIYVADFKEICQQIPIDVNIITSEEQIIITLRNE